MRRVRPGRSTAGAHGDMNGHTGALPPTQPAPHLPHDGANQLPLSGRIHGALAAGPCGLTGCTCQSERDYGLASRQ